LLACNQGSTNKITSDTASATIPVAKPVALEGCYLMTIEKDSAYLELKDSSGILSGPLVYHRFEKDSNTGIFSGTVIKGNRLEGWYRFSSEGMVSVRRVIFKINNNNLSEGYGEMDLKHDTAGFKYPSNLEYEDQHPFIKQACK